MPCMLTFPVINRFEGYLKLVGLHIQGPTHFWVQKTLHVSDEKPACISPYESGRTLYDLVHLRFAHLRLVRRSLVIYTFKRIVMVNLGTNKASKLHSTATNDGSQNPGFQIA